MSRRAVVLRALAVWPVFLVVAIAMGAVRDAWVAPATGEQWAHVIGTLGFVTVMLAIQWWFIAGIRNRMEAGDAWRIGLLWTLMTVGFEFGFFHYAAGVSWDRLLADYNVFAGRLWVLVLAATLCGPRLIFAVTHRSGRSIGSPK